MAKNIIVAIEWVMAHNPQLQRHQQFMDLHLRVPKVAKIFA